MDLVVKVGLAQADSFFFKAFLNKAREDSRSQAAASVSLASASCFSLNLDHWWPQSLEVRFFLLQFPLFLDLATV